MPRDSSYTEHYNIAHSIVIVSICVSVQLCMLPGSGLITHAAWQYPAAHGMTAASMWCMIWWWCIV